MGKSWFSSWSSAGGQLLSGSYAGNASGGQWADFVSFWHARFSAAPTLDGKVPPASVAETQAAIPAAAHALGAAGDAIPAGQTPAADSHPTFEALVDDSGRFGTITSYDFSEKNVEKLTGAGPVESGVWHGSLSGETFEADIAKAMGSALAAGHGLFFTPDDGDFAGEAFLVLDTNGKEGFQPGEDMVMHLLPAGEPHIPAPLEIPMNHFGG